MQVEDRLKELKETINKKVPRGVEVTDVEFEGPEMVIYTDNPEKFAAEQDLIKTLARDLRKRIVVRQSKKKTTYYVREDSSCGFISWDIPQTRKCPKCGDIVLKKKNRDQYYCRSNCGWTEENKK